MVVNEYPFEICYIISLKIVCLCGETTFICYSKTIQISPENVWISAQERQGLDLIHEPILTPKKYIWAMNVKACH